MLLYSLATVTQINPVVDGAVEAVEYALARERSSTPWLASGREPLRRRRTSASKDSPNRQPRSPAASWFRPLLPSRPPASMRRPSRAFAAKGALAEPSPASPIPIRLTFGTRTASKPGNWIPDSRERAPNAIASMALGPGQDCGTCPCTSRIGCRQERCIPARPLRTPPAGRPCAKSQTRLRPVGNWSERLDQSAKSRPCSGAAECRSFR